MAPPSDLDEEPSEADFQDEDLEAMLTDLCRLTARRPPRRGATESWSRVAVTPGLELAARDSDRSALRLLDRIAKVLRRRFAASLNRR